MKKQPSKVAHDSQPAIFFIIGLAAQKAHFRQKYEFYRLSVSPLYNLLALLHTRESLSKVQLLSKFTLLRYVGFWPKI
jgi:hypothetical protein